MNRHLLILLDKTLFQYIFYLFILFSKLFRRSKAGYQPKISGSERFLVIRPGGIGDGLMSLPFLRTLREHYPQNKITLICVQKNRSAFEYITYLDEILVLDKTMGILRCLLLFLKREADVVFDLEPFRKVSSIVAYLTGAGIRIGFDTNDRRGLYTHLISYANDKHYESLNMVRQLAVLGIETTEQVAIDIRFPLPEELLQQGKERLRSQEIIPDRDFILAVVPGVLKKHHRWTMRRFGSFIDRVLEDDQRVRVLLLGVPTDIPDADEVIQGLNNKNSVTNLVGKTSYGESLGLLHACDILVACDGGIVYMAAAMGCSTLSLWGPGVMERFKPPGENHIGIRKDYPCVPCVNYSRLGEFPNCPYDRKCINDISPNDVFEQYRLLKSQLQIRKELVRVVRAY